MALSLSINRVRSLQRRWVPFPDWEGVVIGAVIGLVMGAAALAYLAPIRWLEHALDGLGGDAALGFWVMLFAPVTGAIISGVVFALISSPIPAHGVGQVIWAVHRLQAKLPASLAVKQWIASTGTIGTGGSAGPEGPIVSVGAVVGSQVARFLGTDTSQRTTLLGCGAAAGLAAVFNAPLTGVFFVLEVLLRDFSLKMMAPIVVASVMGAATAQGILQSNEPVFGVGPAQFDAFFFELDEVPPLVILGVFIGLCGGAFVKLLEKSGQWFARLRVPTIVKPAFGAIALGALGLLWCFGFGSQERPEFYGAGYDVISAWCEPSKYDSLAPGGDPWPLVKALGLLLVAKAIATSLTLGSGSCGGLFAPSLVLGAVGGAFCGSVLNAYTPLPEVSPVLCAVVGMAAFVAGGSQAPLTGVMLAYEITRNYSVMLPLLLVAVLSTLISRLVSTHSVYTGEIDRLGLRLGTMADLSLLRRIHVGELVTSPATPMPKTASVEEMIKRAERSGEWDVLVCEADGRYAGMVTAPDLRAALVHREVAPLLTVEEIMRAHDALGSEDTLDAAFDAFSRTDAQSLPIIERRSGRATGLVTRQQVMRAYQQALKQR